MELYEQDRIALRDRIRAELHRAWVRGTIVEPRGDDGSMELFLADDLMGVVDEFFSGWEEDYPECERLHVDEQNIEPIVVPAAGLPSLSVLQR